MSALLSTLPIFILILIGYVLRRTHVIRPTWTRILSSFVYYVSLPALIIYSFINIEWSENNALSLVGYNIIFVALASLITFTLLHFLPMARKTKAVILLAATVGNTVYLGIPIVRSALEPTSDSLSALLTTIAVVQLVSGMAFALVLFELYYVGTKNIKLLIRQFLLNPLVIASLIGVTSSLFGTVPDWVDQSLVTPLSMLAITASPVALVALGSFMVGHHFVRSHIKHLVVVVCIKILLLPLLAWLLMGVTEQSDTNTTITVLFASMPVAITAFVVSEVYNLDTRFAAFTVLTTTVLSLFSTTALIYVL